TRPPRSLPLSRCRLPLGRRQNLRLPLIDQPIKDIAQLLFEPLRPLTVGLSSSLSRRRLQRHRLSAHDGLPPGPRDLPPCGVSAVRCSRTRTNGLSRDVNCWKTWKGPRFRLLDNSLPATIVISDPVLAGSRCR